MQLTVIQKSKAYRQFTSYRRALPFYRGDLGDGLFLLKKFIKLGGRFDIGSDSQVSLKPLSEIQLLEYGQRLIINQEQFVLTRKINTQDTFYGRNVHLMVFLSIQLINRII